MLKNKLLTVIGAVGVLLCGACGIAFRVPPPPPPRMQLFVEARTVRVEVSNHTPTHGIDPAALKLAIIRDINSTGKRTPLRAVETGDADCVLAVDVVKEEEGKDDRLWRFQSQIAIAVTSKDERRIWSNPSWPTFESEPLAAMHRKGVKPDWNDEGLRKAFFSRVFISNLASGLVYEVLSQ